MWLLDPATSPIVGAPRWLSQPGVAPLVGYAVRAAVATPSEPVTVTAADQVTTFDTRYLVEKRPLAASTVESYKRYALCVLRALG
jgi:hypothetical protein